MESRSFVQELFDYFANHRSEVKMKVFVDGVMDYVDYEETTGIYRSLDAKYIEENMDPIMMYKALITLPDSKMTSLFAYFFNQIQ